MRGNNLLVVQQDGGGIPFALAAKITGWLELNRASPMD